MQDLFGPIKFAPLVRLFEIFKSIGEKTQGTMRNEYRGFCGIQIDMGIRDIKYAAPDSQVMRFGSEIRDFRFQYSTGFGPRTK